MNKHDSKAFVQIRSAQPRTADAEHTHENDHDADSNEGTRRRFLELMGASLSLAAGVGCTRPGTQYLMPYVHEPEQVIPGTPKYYATASLVNGIAQGVIVESHLGRPTKIEGNPSHPASLGASSVLAQACVLDLYDPYRSKEIVHKEESTSWEAFMSAFQAAMAPIRTANGLGLSILTETVISPTLGSQIKEALSQLPEAKWHQFDPAGPHSSRAGSQIAFGEYVNTYYQLNNADVILALDSDFLVCGQTNTRYARDFASGRRVRGANATMNRLYVAECSMTATGGKADHRIQLRYADIARFAAELAAALSVPGITPSGDQSFAKWIPSLAADLQSHPGRSAVLVGDHQPAALHALAHAINAKLGNVGQTVIYTEPIEVKPEDQIASIKDLVGDMNAGKVQLLLILGGNPVYNAPADLGFEQALEKVGLSIHHSLYPDETSRVTHWHVPQSHFLETWSDARAFDGTITILQPLIDPLYLSHSHLEMLDLFSRIPNWKSEAIVRQYWQVNSKSSNFNQWWRKSVGTGLIENSALPPITPTLKPFDTSFLSQPGRKGLDLVFQADPYIYDGRYATNSWLQELPKPVTKLTWDNAVHVSPGTAARLKLESQKIVELKCQGRSVEGSVWISPGQADDTITVHLGYGRTAAGVIGNKAGFDAYRIRTSDDLWHVNGVEVRSTGQTYPLATTQMQKWDEGRDQIVSRKVDEYRKDASLVQETHPDPQYNETLYPHWKFSGYSWGMTIDLTACVNCTTCVISCQAENNIPVIGKEQELFSRDLHWLRVDTYYVGNEDNPSHALSQPRPCMQCENAPCESVCPVQATVHSYDGLNDMVYNRCVGTRYCSNNCPYKVRRFNWLLYADWYTEQLKMVQNPDVTVRSRGVMEKCTYCVQRIRETEITARNENRFIRDGEIKTACQQACPTQAIVFGDLNNPANRVSRLKQEKLNYSLLAELNTRPHTTYLAELRNPNPEWEKA
jgi:molybdopterin-containing oxidoreductase family iron-sulfur binding subunit